MSMFEIVAAIDGTLSCMALMAERDGSVPEHG